jgi:hypothetical protein
LEKGVLVNQRRRQWIWRGWERLKSELSERYDQEGLGVVGCRGGKQSTL